jgi:hypothetical protein
MVFHVYILRSASTGRFYVGHTENLAKRIVEHNSNRAAKIDPISVDLPVPFSPTMPISPSPRLSKST